MKKVKTIVIALYKEDGFACCYLVDGDYSDYDECNLIEIKTGRLCPDDEYEYETLWHLADKLESFDASKIPKVIKVQKKLGFKVKVISGVNE